MKAKGLNETHEGNDKDTWYLDDGSPQYFNIVEKLKDLTSVRHEPTKTQYAYKESGGLVSYDDTQAICDKTEYVSNSRSFQFDIRTLICKKNLIDTSFSFKFWQCLENDLNGFIIWVRYWFPFPVSPSN